jgi:serine/threonine protein kinase
MLRGHPNIIRLIDVFDSDGSVDTPSGSCLYLVLERVGTSQSPHRRRKQQETTGACHRTGVSLHRVIRAGILEPIHTAYLTWQLLEAVKHMQKKSVLHGSIKVTLPLQQLVLESG